MLPIDKETICYLVMKAREFHVKEAVVIPETEISPADDWALQILADHKDDPTYNEFSAIVNDLEPDQQLALVVLMWIGRGDYSVNEWSSAVENAAAHRTIPVADYLLTTPMVADYLEEGLVQFGFSCGE